MRYYELDKEEKEILDAVERDDFKSIPGVKKEIERLRSFARASLNREKNINIRLSERDLQKLKAKAAEKGIPYQTLVASVLHQYTDK
ncbi:MAG: hypothetical protein A3H57_00695 [Candidatus Taylorbacteria bacterium RIFCSPLOWO2_02_FULL_43_11]|uniref:Antitoxin n=1 Tax=Candidatus Taylorbacteria bacterium RIFCSPHIGHO2_02_FULL_43_32b TaxID=1802306 RepID=A0A1G2MHT8_9BACT|nr:MAG: hypothetical protein A2743_01600 [Candidatus Taylorbacteria bacterium RIFCSPHIGHO2_01_FULL_43_47]OHA23438.1 MAG: hypothetical protein A3C72_03690 [Candidatus Taylorbacteria bacterium RIFCSPHIGHO2_02_FULL_43_32b]OHA30454.1 MAG: hypothetical protein A3B08_02705 [Candidatus Taylorbacteria bacterium RIFCSPLOWO2_01_FULL_43_44]OHA36995.1 MAG: hypothetical protein A3H57_00695 [Candidatus Taylorbacteria bacterium RIFCSPLOWO2_02_FULL_43_11]